MDMIVNKDVKLGIIGCGKMANAILSGTVKSNFLNSEDVYLYDINKSNTKNLMENYGFNSSNSIEELLKKTNTILISTKPFVINDVMNEIKKYYNNQTILTILAGVKIEKYENYIPDIKLIRIMPNTPALVNEGMSAICPNKNTCQKDIDFALNLMKNCGKAFQTTENKIDVITALSGSGPAYYYKIIELMAKSAVKLGLNEKEALLLSTQTALGSAKMIFENDFDIVQLIKNVTTPGGCTEVGNNVLLNSDIEKVFDKLIKDTMEKAISLG